MPLIFLTCLDVCTKRQPSQIFIAVNPLETLEFSAITQQQEGFESCNMLHSKLSAYFKS